MKKTLSQLATAGPYSVGLLMCPRVLICGCKSDVHHQLLERELRLQEDQIYCLQDKLQTQYYELDTLTDENASLRKQLGIIDDSSLNTKMPSRAPTQPLLVPPQVEVPSFGGSGGSSNDNGPVFGADPSSASGSGLLGERSRFRSRILS